MAVLHSPGLTKTGGPPSAAEAIGEWRLDRRIGEGTFATVYAASPADQKTDGCLSYAVKLLDRRYWRDSLALAQFRQEGLIGRKVRHPHLISILDSATEYPPYYLVMPLLGGETVDRRLERGPISLSQALWIARQSAEAVVALHRGGYLHGDVKPANLQVGRDGHVTLLDLGSARMIQETGSFVDRPLIGTIRYLSPEGLTSTVKTTAKSDVFSLGATLFEMLTERPLYDAETPGELLEQHLQGRRVDVRKLNPQTPLEVAQLVRLMTAVSPERRPTAEEAVARLIAAEIESLASESARWVLEA